MDRKKKTAAFYFGCGCRHDVIEFASPTQRPQARGHWVLLCRTKVVFVSRAVRGSTMKTQWLALLGAVALLSSQSAWAGNMEGCIDGVKNNLTAEAFDQCRGVPRLGCNNQLAKRMCCRWGCAAAMVNDGWLVCVMLCVPLRPEVLECPRPRPRPRPLSRPCTAVVSPCAMIHEWSRVCAR